MRSILGFFKELGRKKTSEEGFDENSNSNGGRSNHEKFNVQNRLKSLPGRKRIQELSEAGDIEIIKSNILEILYYDENFFEAVILLSEVNEGLHSHELKIDALSISPSERWLIRDLISKEISLFQERETPDIDSLAARIRRILIWPLEANGWIVNEILNEVTQRSYKNNPVITKEICIAIFRVLVEFSELYAIEYFWELGHNLTDQRIRRAAFYACKREGFLFEALRLSDSIEEDEEREFEKWKIMDEIEGVIREGETSQILHSARDGMTSEGVNNEEFIRSLISISKSSKIIHQFVELSHSEKSVDELISDLQEFIEQNKEEELFLRERVEFGEFDSDLSELPLHALDSRISEEIRNYGERKTKGEILEFVRKKGIAETRKKQIILASSRVMISSNPEAALELLKESDSNEMSDERIARLVAQCYERIGDYISAIQVLEGSEQPSSIILQRQINDRKIWMEDGYDLDFLGDMSIHHEPNFGTVLYNVHSSLPYITSGYTVRSRGIVHALSESGMNVVVNSRWGFPQDRSDFGGNEDIPESIRFEGVEYRFSPDIEGMSKHKMEEYVQLAAQSILSKALEYRPSIIHACSDHTIGLASAMVARALSIPFIYEMRGVWAYSRAANNPNFSNDPRYSLMIRLERQCAMAADSILVISEALKTEVESWGIDPSKISILPNCVSELPVQSGYSNKEKSESSDEKLELGYLGSIVPYEGLDDLVRAISLLTKMERKEVNVSIAGGGKSEEEIKKMVTVLGVEENFQFIGRIPQENISSFYESIDLVVLPRKGYKVCDLIPPLKPIEAMAYSKTVMMSDVDVAKELQKESRCGFLFERDNPESLAERIRELIGQQKIIENHGEKGRRWVSENRIWAEATKSLIERYASFEIDKANSGTYAEVGKTMEATRHYCRCLKISNRELLTNILVSLPGSEHRTGRNIFTSSIRGLSKIDNLEAVRLFEEFFPLFGDQRSLRTGVTIYNRAKRFDDSLGLISEITESKWKEGMLEFLEGRVGIRGFGLEEGKRNANMVEYLEGRRKTAPAPLNFEHKETGKASDITVACIMDEFSYSCYEHTCEMYQLSALDWKQEIERKRPDFLFIESAWDGKNSAWKGKISHRGSELVELLYWCKKNGIASVFWNKEDPVHFNTFINSARLFDYVFTTDIDCLGKYRRLLGHDRVGFLPFACEPEIHNPIERAERESGICFAGAYYERYTSRSKDMKSIIGKYTNGEIPVVIYDRNFGTEDSRYKFPGEFHDLIRGKLPYEEIWKAYKGFDYALNFNSIKNSQTMMARRVFELMASNTMIISNYSRSSKVLFGDLLISCDDGNESKRTLEKWSKEDPGCKKRRLLALRKVMTEHTYEDRMLSIIRSIGGEMSQFNPIISVISQCDSEEELDLLMGSITRQVLRPKKVIIVSEREFEKVDSGFSDIEIVNYNVAKKRKLIEVVGQCDLVSIFIPLDYYGPNYLTDVSLCTRYSHSDIITKSSFWKMNADEGIELINEGEQYKLVEKWNQGTFTIRADSIEEGKNIEEFLEEARSQPPNNYSCISIDEFSYLQNWFETRKEEVGPEIDKILDLDIRELGVSLSELEEIVDEEVDYGEIENSLGGVDMFELFSEFDNGELSITKDQEFMFIRSFMGDGKHHYHYSKRKLTLEELGIEEGNGKFYFDCEPGLSLSLAFIFFDKEGERIGSIIIPSRTNEKFSIVPETHSILLGIRSYSAGSSLVRGINIGHRNVGGVNFVGSNNRQLVLTNNYPQYDDLYKNAFIHSRIVRYNKNNLEVDVFRMKKNSPLGFHEFEGQEVVTGSKETLENLISRNNYRSVLVHFLDSEMWDVLSKFGNDIDIFVWVHGSEIQPWHRRLFNYNSEKEKENAMLSSREREDFWKTILWDQPENLHLIFVSKYFSEEVMDDYGVSIRDGGFSVIHNPIDTERFQYREKNLEDRLNILSIRTFASAKYANDLTVKAIIELSKRKIFKKLSFTIIGDGPLFKELTEPLEGLNNVSLQQRFLSNEEYEKIFEEFGIFLTPTRWDSQGVGRDEAMACGLVPATNSISAIPEFADSDCAILADSEDYIGLADGIEELANNPDLFVSKSKKASIRVREQTSHDVTIPMEIRLVTNNLDD